MSKTFDEFVGQFARLDSWSGPLSDADRWRAENITPLALPMVRYHESGLVARRLDISVTRLHQIGEKLGIPAARTEGGRRLYTEAEIARLAAWRAEAGHRRTGDIARR
jgi:hypothetical protein